jgi:hypothetical protein
MRLWWGIARSNTFEDAEAPLTTALPREPTAPDPPLQIPSELLPLGHKRRYLRTIQLIEDPLPRPPLVESAAHNEEVSPHPFEKTLRLDKPCASKTRHSKPPPPMARTVSFPVITSTSQKSCTDTSGHSDEQEGERLAASPRSEGPHSRRRDTTLGTTKSMARLVRYHFSVECRVSTDRRRSSFFPCIRRHYCRNDPMASLAWAPSRGARPASSLDACL